MDIGVGNHKIPLYPPVSWATIEFMKIPVFREIKVKGTENIAIEKALREGGGR